LFKRSLLKTILRYHTKYKDGKPVIKTSMRNQVAHMSGIQNSSQRIHSHCCDEACN